MAEMTDGLRDLACDWFSSTAGARPTPIPRRLPRLWPTCAQIAGTDGRPPLPRKVRQLADEVTLDTSPRHGAAVRAEVLPKLARASACLHHAFDGAPSCEWMLCSWNTAFEGPAWAPGDACAGEPRFGWRTGQGKLASMSLPDGMEPGWVCSAGWSSPASKAGNSMRHG